MRSQHSKWHSRSSFVFISALAATLMLGGALVLGSTLLGCSTTAQPKASIIRQAQGAPPPVAPFSGFLGDYSLLNPSESGQTQYRYIRADVKWTQYNKMIIEPVTFWEPDHSTVPAAARQVLTEYFHSTMCQQMAKHFTVVDERGPGVMRLQVALTHAESATPILRTLSIVVWQAHLINKVKELSTGTFAFVGEARAEGRLTDSQSGEILGEGVDQRFGGDNVKAAATWQWQDAERAMDYWSVTLANRLAEVQQEQLRAAVLR
jgi:hypothetical protein